MNHQSVTIAYALREVFKQGYNLKNFFSDVKAGLTVGIVAIPLGMALGIASGVAPQNGLYTALIAGAVIALLGGSRFQVSGPTAAFVVLLVPVVNKFGLSGLLVAGLLAGIILVILGLMGVAEVIQYIPHPVTTGFTTGIAVVIAVIQLKDFLGLEFSTAPTHFHERVLYLAQELPHVQWTELAVGLSTLTVLIVSLRKIKNFPAPVVALGMVTLGTFIMQMIWPESSISTIGNRFTFFKPNGEVAMGIPGGLPGFSWPWEVSTPNFPPFSMTFDHVLEILPYAFSIALLGAIESLLSAVVADGTTRQKHNPNSELIAQGIGNIICPFFGGIPATGAIARTMTNIRFGAVSPVSAVVHAFVILLALLVLAPVINFVPMAALAAVLIFVAYNMAERKHFSGILRTAPRDDRIVLMACFIFTVFTDMTIGVGVGLGLAALLFIRRMAVLTESRTLSSEKLTPDFEWQVPDDVFVYEIRGSLFFGAANRALGALTQASNPTVKTVIIDLSSVHLIDVTGAVAFNSALEKYHGEGKKVILVTRTDSVKHVIQGVEVFKKFGDRIGFCPSLSVALKKMQSMSTEKTSQA